MSYISCNSEKHEILMQVKGTCPKDYLLFKKMSICDKISFIKNLHEKCNSKIASREECICFYDYVEYVSFDLHSHSWVRGEGIYYVNDSLFNKDIKVWRQLAKCDN